MLASREGASATSLQLRRSSSFIANKRTSAINFEGKIQIYKWTGLNYDLIETLPSEEPEQVIHFLINNFHYIVVAEGDIGS